MKKTLYSLAILSIIFVLIINIFTKSQTLTNAIIFSSNLFLKNIFPSLFPMFIISSLLIAIKFPEFLGSIFGKLFNKLFKAHSSSAFVFFISLISGFPSSGKCINDLLNSDKICLYDAKKILLFTFFSNPLFIINTIGKNFFYSYNIGFKIFLSHVLANILLAIIIRRYNPIKNDNYNSKDIFKTFNNNINNTNILNSLILSIKESINTLINVFAIVTFFIIINNVIFNTPDTIIKVFISGLFEMTSALKYTNISSLDINIKMILSCFFISFGGFSVHMQIFSILKEKKIKYLPFLLSRIVHGFLTVIIFILLRMDILF